MRSDATSAEEYLAALGDDRRVAVTTVREAILAGLPDGYVEGIEFGMLSWHVPLSRYPETYNGAPLSYVALASQKSYMSLYLMGIYAEEGNRAWFQKEAAERGAKLEMGKSCVRFRVLEDLPLDLVTTAVARIGVDDYIASYETGRARLSA